MFANIIRTFRFVVARGHHFVAIPSHHCRTLSYHSGTSQHTRTLWRTVPAHFVAPFSPVVLFQNGVQLRNGVWLQNGIQFAKRRIQLRTGFQLQSRGISEEDTITMRYWTPMLTSAVVRRPRQIAKIINLCNPKKRSFHSAGAGNQLAGKLWILSSTIFTVFKLFLVFRFFLLLYLLVPTYATFIRTPSYQNFH